MKWLALASALVLGSLLAVIGFAMIGPGGPNSYVGPARVSAAALIALPVGYWLIAKRALSPLASAAIVIVMGAVALALWIPLIGSAWLLELHGGALVVWTALWTVAALPFLRVVAKRLRRPRR